MGIGVLGIYSTRTKLRILAEFCLWRTALGRFLFCASEDFVSTENLERAA